MPGPSMQTWSSPGPNRLALLGYALMFAAVARAADPVPGPAGSPSSAGFVEAVLSVTVNREEQSDPVVTLRDPSGRIFVAATDLTRWRLRLPELSPTLFRGEQYYPLSGFPGLSATIDERTQTLTIDAPAALFATTELNAVRGPAPRPERSAGGGFVNYSLLGTRSEDANTVAGSFELGAFGRVGIVSNTMVASAGGGHDTVTRLESTWSYAMPEQIATVRAGDVISRAGAWGRAVRFGGVQYATDFATQPNLVLTPGQFIAGAATIPSTVDVFVNNSRVSQQPVKPGPFSVRNIPPINGAGEITLVVHDELGREQVLTRPFYSSPTLLRAGLADFSYDLGFVRENFGIASNDYGTWVASGTYRRGLTDRWTGEVRAEATTGLANAGLSSDLLVGNFGVFSASVAGGRNTSGSGERVAIGFDRQSRGLSFNVQGSWASPRFRQVGDTDPQFGVAREWLASASYDFGRYGTIAAAYVARHYRTPQTEVRPESDTVAATVDTTIASIGYTVSVDRWGYVGVSLSRVRAVDRTTEINVTWTVPFGSTMSATLSADRVRNNLSGVRDERTLTVQRDLPLGEGFGFRARASDHGPRQAELAYQNRYGTYVAEIAQAQGQTGERISANGGIGLIEGHLFLGRLINDSFGLVRLPGYPGVRIYSENQVVGRTDGAGELVVPRLLPYQRNTLRIEQADLPLDAEFDVLARDAVPYYRSGVVVRFPVRPARGALVKIVQEDSTPVPAGAVVHVEGQDGAFPVALEGDVYLTGLLPRNRVTARWRGQECAFDFDYPETADPQPRLGPFVCRRLH